MKNVKVEIDFITVKEDVIGHFGYTEKVFIEEVATAEMVFFKMLMSADKKSYKPVDYDQYDGGKYLLIAPISTDQRIAFKKGDRLVITPVNFI